CQAGAGADVAADIEPLGTLEVGLHVSGSAAAQRRGRSVVAAGRTRSDCTSRGEMSSIGRVAAALLVAVAVTAPLLAQRGQPAVDLTPLVETDPAGKGADLHLALKVHLPEGYHTNSNKPRDPSLIPVRLT